MNKYIKNYILSVTNAICSLVFPIITFPYVSRVLGPSNLGVINFAQSYGYYFMHMASFGISSYAIREVSKVRDDEIKMGKICNEIFNLNLLFSILSTLLFFCGVFLVENFRSNVLVFTIYSITILSNFLSLEWLLQSFDDYFFSTVRNFIIQLVSLIVVFIFVKKEDDLILYMVVFCIAGIGTKISSLLYVRKKYVKLTIGEKFLNFRGHIKPLFTLFTFRLVNGLSANLDKLMIGFMMIYASVGVYSAGVKLVLMLVPIIETVGIVLFPKINISAVTSQQEYMKNIIMNYNIILLMSIPMAIGIYLISGRLIPLFAGTQYTGAVSVSRIMSVIIILCPIGDMLGSKTLLVFKKDKWLLYCSCLVAISNIVLNVIFIPLWGINGAAGASVLSYIIAVLSRYYFTRKLVKIHLFSRVFMKYSVFTVPFITIYIFFKEYIDNNTMWMFGFVLLCAFIYLVELLVTKDRLLFMAIKKISEKHIMRKAC